MRLGDKDEARKKQTWRFRQKTKPQSKRFRDAWDRIKWRPSANR